MKSNRRPVVKFYVMFGCFIAISLEDSRFLPAKGRFLSLIVAGTSF